MSELRSAMRAQFEAGKRPADVVADLAREHEAWLAEVESAKEHPLRGHQLKAEEFEALAAHLLDGGGVVDRRPLARAIAADCLAGVQGEKFMANVWHLVKCVLKSEGHLRPAKVAEDAGPGVARGVTVNNVVRPFQAGGEGAKT